MSSSLVVRQRENLIATAQDVLVEESLPEGEPTRRIDSGRKNEISEVFCQMLLDVTDSLSERSAGLGVDIGED